MPQDPYADELSYERDIVPLQKRYFQSAFRNQNLNPNAAAALSQQFSGDVAGAYAERQRMALGDQELKQRKLQFDSAMFSLDREREKANRERTMLETLAPFQKQLDDVLSNQTLDAQTRQQAVAKLTVQNANLIALNPAAAVAAQAAQNGILAEKKKTASMFDAVHDNVDPEILSAYAKEKGMELDWKTELPVLDYLKLKTTSDLMRTAKTIQTKQGLEEQQLAQQGAIDLAKSASKQLNLAKIPNSLTDELDPNKWESPTGPATVQSLLNAFGTPQEQAEIPKLSPAEQIKRVMEIAGEGITRKRKPFTQQTTKPSFNFNG